ncbi:MAG: DpnI domain-containing protein [Bacteroidales bacterium]|nr:DpnI domain-containing protein [Bacteroidales bacterium]
MDLKFDLSLAEGYKSGSQIARVLTEDWLARNMYCPICGETTIKRAEPNAPVKDYVCEHCKSQYELKSKNSKSDIFPKSVADGVYSTMISRITSLDNPSFFFMHYDRYEVNNLIIVPKCFFTPDVIFKRKPLPPTARRAGWTGCNILLGDIPNIAKITIIHNGAVRNIEDVVQEYQRVYNLQSKTLEGRGWLIDVLHCVERLDTDFTLNQMYSFANELSLKHPNNNHIQDKIRQQLQYLRDKGIIEFKGRGAYRRIK